MSKINATNKLSFYIGIVAAALFGIAVIIFSSSGRIGKDFCIGKKGVRIQRIAIKGQGREASITDKATIDYLIQRPKFRPLPPGEHLNGGFSYEARLYAPVIGSEKIVLLIGDDEKVIRLGYFESLFSETTDTFLVVGSDAPQELKDLIKFLLSKTSRGKIWKETTNAWGTRIDGERINSPVREMFAIA